MSLRSLGRHIALAMVVGLILAPGAGAYSFPAAVKATGPEEMVFDWSAQRCDDYNIPDLPVRAIRDASNNVHLLLQHWTTRQFVGPNLNSVTLSCNVTLASNNNGDASAWDDRQWLASPYTLDGTTVYALLHEEHLGNQHPGQCSSSFPNCWVNALTLGVSTNGGASYSHAAPPKQLVASVPYGYVPDVPVYGYEAPTNIVKRPDGYYYALLRAEPYREQAAGACLMRTNNLGDPSSWRAWNGTGFTVQFVDPYRSSLSAAEHVCQPVSQNQIYKMTDSLTFNTWLGQYLLVGTDSAYDSTLGHDVHGVYYSTSVDLIHWSPRKLMMEAVLPSTHRCGDEDSLQYPSLIDPNSQSRNFETTGRTMYLYLTRHHYDQYCNPTLDRDLIRIPIAFPVDPPSKGFPRPRGATPLRVALVLAYNRCTNPNRKHGVPMAVGSCNPPVQTSKFLTVGTLDANGKPANATGFARYQPILGNPSTTADEADVKLIVNTTDVRRKSDLADYTGELNAWVSLRITDRNNGDSLAVNAATTSDIAFSFAVPCQATSDTTRGSTCSVSTTADAVAPGAVPENKRSNWQLGKIQLLDGGADSRASTGPNGLFESQGFFVP